MKTKDIIDEFEKCKIEKEGKDAHAYVEVYKHLEDKRITYDVSEIPITPTNISRHVRIVINGFLPPTKAQVEKNKEKEEERQENEQVATMSDP